MWFTQRHGGDFLGTLPTGRSVSYSPCQSVVSSFLMALPAPRCSSFHNMALVSPGHLYSVDSMRFDPYKNTHVLMQGDTVPERIIVFDTTLRDGEQSPGCSMNLEEKVRMARQLDALGVDVIEAGFPMASQDDFPAVHAAAREVRRPVIAALARTTPNDHERAWPAIQAAAPPRPHTSL